MNIRIFKAKLRRWIYRSERESWKARDCNKCCLTCKRYFMCLGTDAIIMDFRRFVEAGQVSAEFAERCIKDMEESVW